MARGLDPQRASGGGDGGRGGPESFDCRPAEARR